MGVIDEFIAGVEGGGEDDGGHDVVGVEERCDEGSDERVPGCECREAYLECFEPGS